MYAPLSRNVLWIYGALQIKIIIIIIINNIFLPNKPPWICFKKKQSNH